MEMTTVYRSVLDPSIEVLTSSEAMALAEAHPLESKYREWVHVLKITPKA